METLIANDSPVDRFLHAPAKNSDALSDSAKRGMNIFQSFGGVALARHDRTLPRSIQPGGLDGLGNCRSNR